MPTLHQWIEFAIVASLTYFAAISSVLRQLHEEKKKELKNYQEQIGTERQGWLEVNKKQHQHILECHRKIQAKDKLIESLQLTIRQMKQPHDN